MKRKGKSKGSRMREEGKGKTKHENVYRRRELQTSPLYGEIVRSVTERRSKGDDVKKVEKNTH